MLVKWAANCTCVSCSWAVRLAETMEEDTTHRQLTENYTVQLQVKHTSFPLSFGLVRNISTVSGHLCGNVRCPTRGHSGVLEYQGSRFRCSDMSVARFCRKYGIRKYGMFAVWLRQ